MTYTRKTQFISVTIQLPNSAQPTSGLSLLRTAYDEIVSPDGESGYPQHRQEFVIPGDMTPEFVGTLNGALEYLGYQLTPIDGAD